MCIPFRSNLLTICRIKSLLLFFGPILLPKAIAYYRSITAAPSIDGVPIRPVPQRVSRALMVLILTTLAFFLRSLPFFAAENIFKVTQSRLQTPTDVMFTRLAAIRPHGLTPFDETLKMKINSLESRLLFFQFGPDVIANCQFCNPEDPNSHLYYALPGIFGPHLLNLVILAMVTSGLLVGKEGEKWRMTATLAAGAIALGEVYSVSTYAYQANARAPRLEDIDFFYSKMRMYRNAAIAIVDALLCYGLYLSSTNRAFVTPPTTAESIENSLRVLDSARSKIGAVGILRNTINRDEGLRGRSQGYWQHEVRLTGEVMEEREVVDSVNNAMTSNRINIATIAADAAIYAENVVAPLEGIPGMNGAI
jgi:hypothetical protein